MPDRPRKGPNVVLLVVALVAAIAIAAVIMGSGGGDDDDSATATTAAGTSQTQPVQITGTPLAEYGRSQTDPAVGKVAPVVTGESFTGDPVTIGKGPALIVFVAHWCPHCRREVPLLVKYFGEHEPSGVDVYAVATSTSKDGPNYPPSSWLAKEQWPFPVLADSASFQAADAYGLSAFPYFVAIDKDGKVVARGTGELETDEVASLVEAAKG